MRHPLILDATDTTLVVVDPQEPFLRGVHDRERVIGAVRLLIGAARILGVPRIATTQYAARMGGLVDEVVQALGPPSEPIATSAATVDKMTFSCAGSPAFMERLESGGRKRVVLCGVETHICVSQTALDLVARGFQVHVAADAVSARSLEKHKLGMERLRAGGAIPCAAEAAVYEWLGAADGPLFKQILALVKQ